ncbi:MAG: IS110 family transposase [Acidobacteriaceae bacterium]|nr:IS110 family transposase [Acidobacteriaceae bacterium]
MRFAGLDVHKKEVEAVVVEETGAVLLRQRLATEGEKLEEFARRHLSDCRVALEATTNSWAIAGILAPLVKEVVVSNPLRTRAIAEAKIKTDRVDALVLAQLLRCDYLPRVWMPEAETRRMRQRSSERANLSADRTRVKNRIHAVLQQRLLQPPVQDLFSQRGRIWLERLALDAESAATLGRQLGMLALIEQQIAELDQELAEAAYQQPEMKLLLTLPGVDVTVAQTVLAALGDVSRFANPDKAAAYLGLVPSTRQSGHHCYHGRITKQGASHARWMLVQAAQQVARHPGPLGVFFRRLLKRKNRNVAVVATARKLVTIAWHMLKNNEPYRYAQPKTVQAKLSRLRVRATGKRRKGGFAKGQARPAHYGSGARTRALPSLDQIYAGEQLPALAAFSPGEEAMLAQHGVTAYAACIRKSHRVRRSSE